MGRHDRRQIGCQIGRRVGRWARPRRRVLPCLVLMLITGALSMGAAGAGAWGADLPATIGLIKPSIVGVGTFDGLRRPAISLVGTGFIVGDGHYVATNYHVVKPKAVPEERAALSVFLGTGSVIDTRRAEIVGKDEAHDTVLLKMAGPPGPPLRLAGPGQAREGQAIAFTGFPIGAVYGFYPVTHRGTLSAITPIVIPQVSPSQLSAAMIRRLKGRFDVYQLDATAYPGNSGSPVYEPGSGVVLAIVSSVFVKRSKEHVLSEPSGISFAIPVSYLRNLLAEQGQITTAPRPPDKAAD